MLPTPQPPPGSTPTPIPSDGRASRRLRLRVNVMLHPNTLDNLDSICRRLQVTRGVVIDRVVGALWREYSTDTCHCAHGERCPTGRRDVPTC